MPTRNTDFSIQIKFNKPMAQKKKISHCSVEFGTGEERIWNCELKLTLTLRMVPLGDFDLSSVSFACSIASVDLDPPQPIVTTLYFMLQVCKTKIFSTAKFKHISMRESAKPYLIAKQKNLIGGVKSAI